MPLEVSGIAIEVFLRSCRSSTCPVSIRFYRDVLGFTVTSAPPPSPKIPIT